MNTIRSSALSKRLVMVHVLRVPEDDLFLAVIEYLNP
jgi:hypothetical protein